MKTKTPKGRKEEELPSTLTVANIHNAVEMLRKNNDVKYVATIAYCPVHKHPHTFDANTEIECFDALRVFYKLPSNPTSI